MSVSLTAEDYLELAYRRNAGRYARAVDANEPALLAQVMTGDAVIDSLGIIMNGHEAILKVPGMLRDMFLATEHLVHNQTAQLLSDSTAKGESLPIEPMPSSPSLTMGSSKNFKSSCV